MEIVGEKPTEKADSERHGLGCLQEMQEKALFLLISLSTLIVFVGFIKGNDYDDIYNSYPIALAFCWNMDWNETALKATVTL